MVLSTYLSNSTSVHLSIYTVSIYAFIFLSIYLFRGLFIYSMYNIYVLPTYLASAGSASNAIGKCHET